MNSKFENKTLTIDLEGRIDSSNSPTIEEEIFKEINKVNPENIVLDADKLEYISSAGLRVILKIKKFNSNTEVINAHNEVYDIFEMTGFTEMMSIKKAYRELSVDGCEVIGKGANGIVYRIDPDTILKLYFNSADISPLSQIHKERELARKAFVLGIPTAIPYDVVKVGDKYGSVFELLSAKSFAQLISSGTPSFSEVMKMYVDLLLKIHSTPVKEMDMPSMKEEMLGWLNEFDKLLSKDYLDKLIRMVNEIPVDMHMLHGDYHVKNVMLQNNEALLIDMDTLCYGNSIFEWGNIYNAYIGYGLIDQEKSYKFLGVPEGYPMKIWNESLKEYFKDKTDQEREEIANKSAVLGLIRIVRHCFRKEPENLQFYKDRLIEAIDKVDNLII